MRNPRFVEAAAAFRSFFNEQRDAFLEREALFTQLELALLCKEHVLVIGPPGTAKSAIAGAVLGRIVDEKTAKPSLFAKQLAENTVQSIETSSLHLDLISDLKRINSHICSIAYPILDSAGALSPTRFRQVLPEQPSRVH